MEIMWGTLLPVQFSFAAAEVRVCIQGGDVSEVYNLSISRGLSKSNRNGICFY